MSAKNQCLITVAIPSYNHANYIEKCIESIASQSWKNIEIIIIDDGSKDHSVEVIQSSIAKYKNHFSAIKTIYRENQGLCKTLNQALDISSGEYFSPIASDDYFLNEKIEKLVNIFKKNSASKLSAVYGGVNFIDKNGEATGRNYKGNNNLLSFEDFFLFKSWVPAPGALFLTSDLREIGGFNPETKVEDLDILLRLTKNGKKIFFSNEIVAAYRLHESNTSKNIELMHLNVLKILESYKYHSLYKKAINAYDCVIFRDFASKNKVISIKKIKNVFLRLNDKRLYQGLFKLFFEWKNK
ncbi:glycosyltransferase [Comamonas jiangduensis]|uniref:glycosyltransferase n=1 Tax=Comamonas jiangduensis TaxID=1194168 RepID=UPI003BF7FB9B